MRYIKNGPYYQLKLEPGDEIVATLVAFLRRHRIKSSFLTAIGAAEDVVLGCFDPKKKGYHRRTFPGDHEVAALVGNTGWTRYAISTRSSRRLSSRPMPGICFRAS